MNMDVLVVDLDVDREGSPKDRLRRHGRVVIDDLEIEGIAQTDGIHVGDEVNDSGVLEPVDHDGQRYKVLLGIPSTQVIPKSLP